MICKKENLDFDKVRHIMRDGYSRNTNIPSSGFSAGPCLLKDTMQLASFYNNKLPLGYAAMQINQGLPKFIIKELEKRYDLRKKTIGLLGLAFKAETDDVRDSLAIELKKILKLKKIKTLVSDEYYNHKDNIDKNSLIKKSDIVILSTPHKIYKKLKIKKNKVLVDVWGFFDKKKK
jgi:UDP-N-acetyl-D-mannosaminuronic acid dehydrogenase